MPNRIQLQVLVSGVSDLLDASLMSIVLDVLPLLESFSTLSSAADATDDQVEAVRAFIAEHRVAVHLFTGEESGVSYSKKKDFFRRFFMYATPSKEAETAELKAFIGKHLAVLQRMVKHKLALHRDAAGAVKQ